MRRIRPLQSRRLLLALIVPATFLLGTVASSMTPARIDILPSPPGTVMGGTYTVSSNGRVHAGWARDAVSQLQIPIGWRVERESIETIDPGDLPGGAVAGLVEGVSADGSVWVGASESDAGQQAFRWTRETGMVALPDLPGGIVGSFANGVSADGKIVVGYSYGAEGRQAVMWTDSGVHPLGWLPATFKDGYARAITPDGRVIVGSTASGNRIRPFRWTEETGMVAIPTFDGNNDNTHTLAVSDDGRVVAGYISSNDWTSVEVSWIWSEENGFQGIGDLAGGVAESWAWDLNTDGSLALGYGMTDDGKTAYVWDRVHGQRVLQDMLAQDYGLDLTGWHLRDARGFSYDGRKITGDGIVPGGRLEGFVVTLPPACDDGLDNDDDGFVDFPVDPGCPTAYSNTERPACDDGRDNDGDGLIDFDDVACTVSWPYNESCGLGAELVLVMPMLGWLGRRGRGTGR